jgi:predicted DNA repair protein MutK
MATGLLALLDDVATIAKLAASSIDDAAAAAGKAGTKALGVVVDDSAVTPRYVSGIAPARELPIIGKIALGSLRNKLLLLLPVALALSAWAPWAITPLLMIGGAYLCFEGAEKLAEAIGHHHAPTDKAQPVALSAEQLEDQRVEGAVRTDLILSAEIMAIALGEVAAETLSVQALALAVVGVVITAAVYGFVGLLVKLDDIGVSIWRSTDIRWLRSAARALVRAMPALMAGLSNVGIVAMLWVGGGIFVHGLETFGGHAPFALSHWAGETITALVPGPIGAGVAWVASALLTSIIGLVVGAVATALAPLRWRGTRSDQKQL